MSYSERAYFDGDFCQHVADRDEAVRLNRIMRQARQARPVRVSYGMGGRA